MTIFHPPSSYSCWRWCTGSSRSTTPRPHDRSWCPTGNAGKSKGSSCTPAGSSLSALPSTQTPARWRWSRLAGRGSRSSLTTSKRSSRRQWSSKTTRTASASTWWPALPLRVHREDVPSCEGERCKAGQRRAGLSDGEVFICRDRSRWKGVEVWSLRESSSRLRGRACPRWRAAGKRSCPILKVLACKSLFESGKMGEAKIYNEFEHLKFPEHCQAATCFDLVWQLSCWLVCFTSDISTAGNWHLTFYTFHLDMAMHGIRVDFMQVAFQSWREIGSSSRSCSASLLILFAFPHVLETGTTRRNVYQHEWGVFGVHGESETPPPHIFI